MMALVPPFSKRHGFRGEPKEITVREDAPESLRYFVVQTSIDGGLLIPEEAAPQFRDDVAPL
jgi:hypothetical protein